MALTRLDNLISSKTGKYLYVSPDDFNASDELNNRGNSPVRPFRSIQRAFLEISRFSYLPGGPDNDRFDQFTVMVMPGNHYIDNRPGLVGTDGIDEFTFDQALSEWTDNSNLDIKDPNNVLYKFNNTEGGAIIPRGSSIIGYDLRRTMVRPLYVPDPADPLEKRSAIFNVTGGCYFWQFTIKDGDLEPSSPLYDTTEGVGKVYSQTPSDPSDWGTSQLSVPNFSHHKLTVFEYADKQELGLYYRKIAKAFSQYQPNIDDLNEFGARIQETRIVGPLSDIRSIESIRVDDRSTEPSLAGSTTRVTVTTKVDHSYFKNQFVAIQDSGLDDEINGTFSIDTIDETNGKVFSYLIEGTVATLGTTTNLISGTTYTVNSSPVALGQNANVKAEVDSVESASPYVFNCSIRSTWGICGIWANGLKATGFKSMVIAQYTGVSLQKDDRAFIRYDEFTNTFNQASLKDAFATVPYHTKGDAFWKDDWRNFHVRASEDSFIQCVSIFAVGFADHFLMESGGDMSITNSNSNFGNTSLHAIGHKGYAFNQDKGGYIDAIIPPKKVEEVGNTKRQSYYTIDIQASNDQSNNTKLFLGDDEAYDPTKRPAATIGGYRIGAKSDEKIFVKLSPRTTGGNAEFHSTLTPNGFKKFTATPDILNPDAAQVNNKAQDAANLIEANKEFIAYEAYGYITSKYPALLIKQSIQIVKCRRDIGYLLDATISDLRLGGNINTIQAAESYYVKSGGTDNLSFINNELPETLEGYYYARDLAIAALRNYTYKRTGVETTAGNSIIKVGDSSGIVPGMTVADYAPSEFDGNYLKNTATRPAQPVVPDNTFVKRIVDATTVELGQRATTSVKQVASDRHGNARELILANKTFIATEAYERMLLDYPNYTPSTGYNATTGKAKCIDDLEKAIDAIAENTGYGGNDKTWDAAYYYDSGSVQDLAAKKDETITAFNYCKDMAIQVMRKENVFIYGTHGLTQSSVTANDPITSEPAEVVNDKNGDARNLILANKSLIAHESVERMIRESSTERFTPTGAVYNPTTGDLTLSIDQHGLIGADSYTVASANYNPQTGVMTVVVTGHDFANGERVKFDDDSLTFTCSMGAGNKTYPRASDPVSGKWLTIFESDPSNNTFKVNVGKSEIKSFTPTAADYNPTTGLMTLTIGNHGLSAGTSVKLLAESLKFSCGFGGATGTAAEKSYPRSSDPFYNTAINIESVTTTTITLQVLATQPSTNVDAHTFVSALAGAVITGGDYVHTFVPASSGTNNLKRAADSLRFDYNAFTFECDMDGRATQHTYPRIGDPAGYAVLPIGVTTADAVTINVGKTLNVSHDVSTADYNPNTGDITLDIGSHNLKVGTSIKIPNNSLSFKCSKDNFTSTETYPRAGVDPYADKSIEITKIGSSFHKATDADYDPATGIIKLTVPNHGFAEGNKVRIADGSLVFTCAMDNNATEHSYPRPTDPVSGEWLTISDVEVNTFKVNVEAAGGDHAYTPTNGSYDAASGELTLTIGGHDLKVGDGILIKDNSLAFTCTMDGNDSVKTYPRTNKDNASSRSLPIVNKTDTTVTVNVGNAGDNKYYTPSTGSYNPKTGNLDLNIGQHGLAAGSNIVLKDNSLKFTCDKPGGGVESYPRPGVDPKAGKSIDIDSVGYIEKTATGAIYNPTTGDLTVTSNGHQFDGPQEFTPLTAAGSLTAYDPATGILTLNIPNHGLVDGEYIRIKDGAISFTCTKDSDTQAYEYPRATDPASGKNLVVSNAQQSTFDVNVGVATGLGQYVHTVAGAVTGGVTSGGDYIQIVDNSLAFTCDLDPSAAAKTYPRQGFDYPSGRWLQIRSATANDFTVNVGKSSNLSTHTADPTAFVANGIRKQTGVITLNVGQSDISEHTPGDATTYDPTTGLLVLDIGSHTLSTSDSIRIADGAMQFKCEEDGKSTPHAYPRASDPISGKSLSIQAVTATTVTIQVLDTVPSTNVTAHEFVAGSGVANSVSGGDDYIHTWDSAVTGAVEYVPQSTHTWAASQPNTTLCVEHKPQSAHTFKRGLTGGIARQSGTITVNVGVAASADRYAHQWAGGTATGAVVSGGNYSHYWTTTEPNSVHKVFSVAGNRNYHDQDCVDDVVDLLEAIADNVAYGGNDKTWDAAYSYKTGAHVAGFKKTVNNATYTPADGNLILDIGAHTHKVGERVHIPLGALTFKCEKDNYDTEHSYPRASDPIATYDPSIKSVAGTTITINVGPANDATAGVHQFVPGTTQIFVGGEEIETNEVFRHAKDMAGQVIKNQKVLQVGSHHIAQVYDETITEDTPTSTDNKNGDAYNLLIANAELIAAEAYHRMILEFPDFTPPTGNPQDCRDDIKDFVVEIAHNVGFGGNDRVWDMSNLYVTGAHVVGEEAQTLKAFEDAKEIMVQVSRNEKVLIGGTHGKTQTFYTGTTDPSVPVNNKVIDAANLITSNKNFVAEIALGRMLSQYSNYVPAQGYTTNDCLDDLKDVVDVVAHNLAYGGNDRVWDTALLYNSGGHADGHENETIFGFNAVRDIIRQVIVNEAVTVGGYTSLPQATDTSITNGVANGDCDDAKATVTTLVGILTNAIASPSSLYSIDRTESSSKCVNVVSSINTLYDIVKNAINTPESLTGSKASVSGASYDPTTGIMELEVGTHTYQVGESVDIPVGSLGFTCTLGSGTKYYPRATDPAAITAPTITAVTGTTISVQVLDSVPSTNQNPHTFVSSTANLTIGGIIKTVAGGKCDNIKSTINTLFDIVTTTVANGSALDSISRNISNGPCQEVASTVTTLFSILTNTIKTVGYLDTVDKTEIPLGLVLGQSVNANSTTTDSYIWFTWPTTGGVADNGIYTTKKPDISSSFNNDPANDARKDSGYPQCVNEATAVRQYFTNIGTIIQSGLGSVTRNEPTSSSALSRRATVWTLIDPSKNPPQQSDPHRFETGTPVRLVPRPKAGVTVDKRNVRLPNGFNTNQEYYVIAPGRSTNPQDFSATTSFNGSQQDVLMLASSKENAAAGIYLHSQEVSGIHPDVEIDLYQFTIDDSYDLHQYECTLVSNGIQTDVSHIFDLPKSNVPEGHPVFFRAQAGKSLPTVGGTDAADPNVAYASGINLGKLRGDLHFYARYITPKVFKIYRTHDDAINDQSSIDLVTNNDIGFNVFADKRTSPMRYDPSHTNSNVTDKGKWFLQVEPNSAGAPATSQEILARLHDQEYNDASGNTKSNDTWYTRLKDDRSADDRIYRLRYVIPSYLKSVRDPLNGFTIKMRKDETRKLLPQKIVLKPKAGNSVTKAIFNNTADSGQANEIIGMEFKGLSSFATPGGNQNALDPSKRYDPFKKDLSGGGREYQAYIRTDSKIQATIQSGRYFVDGVSGDTLLELTVFDHEIDSQVPGLKNENLTTVKITAPQGGSFIANNENPANGYFQNTKVEWDGADIGSGYIHAALNVPGTDTWHLILKGISGTLDYSSTEDTRFTQTQANAVVFADQLADPDGGKSLALKTLIKKEYPEYYYRQNASNVYTLTAGDEITDQAGNEYYIASVNDVGEIDDTFYIFNVETIQRRIFEQQDGIFYLTAVRGDVSPYPTGAGNLNNFRNFKFSQPISKLYPLNYKNDPVWFKQLDSNFVDPPATYSAADNYVHGLVTVNDFKGSITKETIFDIIATDSLANNTYNVKPIEAQSGNAASGSEDRQIPIAGDNTVVVDQRLYVELRRPSIARAGNHTFEYLGFGPGNYSTGLPARQEVLLTTTQDFYSQSKKQDGGLVFYTGLNSNGDLYIGNRKIDAITGEEVFLESATLVDSEDPDDIIDSLVTTFDTPVTFNKNITVNGGDDGDLVNTFNSPVTVNVASGLGLTSFRVLSTVNPNATPVGDDESLDRSSQQGNTLTNGDIVLNKNMIAASVFQFNPRGSNGFAQGYKIQNHVVAAEGSNATPSQSTTAKDYFDSTQVVRYGTNGALPVPGDILLKGDSVGSSGSIGWIYANSYSVLGDQTASNPDHVFNVEFDGSNLVKINWKNSKQNGSFGPKITAATKIRIKNCSELALNGVFDIDPNTYDETNTFIKIIIGASIVSGPILWNSEATASMEYADTSWKEWGVLGSEAIRTETSTLSDYKVGINTVARSGGSITADSWKTGFVNESTKPQANLDVHGNAIITGYETMYSTGTFWGLEDAFLVGIPFANLPNNAAIFRVNAQTNRVGINVSDDKTGATQLDKTLTVNGDGRFTGDVKFEQDIDVNGGGPGPNNTAEIRTSITDGTFEFLMDSGFYGAHDLYASNIGGTNGLKMAGSAKNIEVGNVATGEQEIEFGSNAAKSWIDVGSTAAGDGTNAHISRISIGGAFLSTETDSYTQVNNKEFKIAGDVLLGQVKDKTDGSNITRRGAGDTTFIRSTAEKVSFLGDNSATTIVDFATNASNLTIAGQGGSTRIRNNTIIDSTLRVNSDITLCGGLNNFSFTASRKQAGSTTMLAHTNGIITTTTFNKNVDIIDVLRVTAPTSAPANNKTAYNRIDTGGSGSWGDATWSQQIPQASLPALPTGQFYLPLKYSPFYNMSVANPDGDQYFSENDILLIDSNEGASSHAEFVKIVSLPRIVASNSPYYIVVSRQPFGTFTTTSSTHLDTTSVYKCTIQLDSTWLTEDIDASAGTKTIKLAQFGGSLDVDDYVIISREDGTPANDGVDDQGEIFKLDTVINAVSKKLSVKKGCDSATEETVFEVDSVTGSVIIGNTTENTVTTINGSVILQGKCGSTNEIYPSADTSLDSHFTIKNTEAPTFNVNICNGDTVIGTTVGTVYAIGEYYGSTAIEHGDSTVVTSYVWDPQTIQAAGPITTTSAAVTTATWSIPISGNVDAFQTGDLVALVDGSDKIELFIITDDPVTDAQGNSTLPTIYNAGYPAGTYPTGGRGAEGTAVQAFDQGVQVVKINKVGGTTTLIDPIGATGRIAVESPNQNNKKIRVRLHNSNVVSDKLDYLQFLKFETGGAIEWFYPDSIDGVADQLFGVRLSKSTRLDTNGNFLASGTHTRYFGGGQLTVHDHMEMIGGNFRMYGSDGKTLVFNVANDDDHYGDGSVRDEKTEVMGMYVNGGAMIGGNLKVMYEDCQTNGTCAQEIKFQVFGDTGSVDMGEKLYVKGALSPSGDSQKEIFHVDNLGPSGGTTSGSKDWIMYQDSSIDAFGINRYFTRNGGRRYTYVEQSATGIGQTQANALQPNNNYLINTSSGSNIVMYLPETAETGDMIRFVEVSGNLTYNTSLVLRALKVNNVPTAIQGDTTGTKIQAGAGQMQAAWDSGELVVQTRNASFGLIYVGPTDAAGDPNASTVPSNLRGWWLTEL